MGLDERNAQYNMTYVCLQAYLCGKTRLEGLLRYRGSCLLHDLNGVSKAAALLVPKPLFDRYPELSGVVASINKGMAVVAGQGRGIKRTLHPCFLEISFVT